MKRDPGTYTHAIYWHPDRGDDPQVDHFEMADRAWMAKVQRFLVAHYAHHHFCADIDIRQGVIKVYIPELMGAVNGYVLKPAEMVSVHDFDREMHRACGEILERYRIPRSRFSRDDFMAALTRAPIIGLDKAPVPT